MHLPWLSDWRAQHWFFGGRLLPEKQRIDSTRIHQGHVVQIIVRDRDLSAMTSSMLSQAVAAAAAAERKEQATAAGGDAVTASAGVSVDDTQQRPHKHRKGKHRKNRQRASGLTNGATTSTDAVAESVDNPMPTVLAAEAGTAERADDGMQENPPNLATEATSLKGATVLISSLSNTISADSSSTTLEERRIEPTADGVDAESSPTIIAATQ